MKKKNKIKKFNKDVPSKWSVEDVSTWLKTFNFGFNYTHAFRSCQVNGAILLHLTRQILSDILGIYANTHARQLVAKIDELRSISLCSWLSESYIIKWIENGIGNKKRKKINLFVENKVENNIYNSNFSNALIPTCAVCGSNRDIQRCSKCKKSFYCSRDHQVRHWPQHAPHCVSID